MSNLEQLVECCNNVIKAMEQDRLGKSDYKQGYIKAMELVIRKAKQLQKEEPKDWKKHFVIDDEKSLEAYMEWRKSPKTYTQELEEENKYLKAEFEANKDKVFTQEDMDMAIEQAWIKGQRSLLDCY